jgi:hypothetical protein
MQERARDHKKNAKQYEEDLEELVERYQEADVNVPYYSEELSDGGERNEMINR